MCRRAEEATKAYCELAGVLSQAPDPLPFLHALQPLQKCLAEVQRENKRLQLYGQAAESEASSASEAVLKNRELERQVAELQAELKEKVWHVSASALQNHPYICNVTFTGLSSRLRKGGSCRLCCIRPRRTASSNKM